MSEHPLSTADVADRHRQLIAFVFFVAAVKYAATAAIQVVSEEVGRYLDCVEVGAVVLMLGLMLPILVWKIVKLPKAERHIYLSTDGYAAQTLVRAQKVSWIVTFILLTLVAGMTDRLLAHVPPSFFVNGTVAVMLVVVSTVFFSLNRADDLQDPEPETRA